MWSPPNDPGIKTLNFGEVAAVPFTVQRIGDLREYSQRDRILF